MNQRRGVMTVPLSRTPAGRAETAAFTLIELSIVLVIIGLIVGGVLVGQDLIRAAAVRAQISQIEKYQTAVNTFRGKYNALPGDLNAATASQFGFAARGAQPGQGDGNGVIEGWYSVGGPNQGYFEGIGETTLFWVDLSTANLIEGQFSTATATGNPSTVTLSTTPSISAFFPPAKLGRGNYVYVWSGGIGVNGGGTGTDGTNYFGLSATTSFSNGNYLISTPALTVLEAYSIDKKTDDGLPQSGRVMAMYINEPITFPGAGWAAGGGALGGNPGAVPPGSASSCYDSNSGAVINYSVQQNGGAGVNCALSFQFQ